MSPLDPFRSWLDWILLAASLVIPFFPILSPPSYFKTFIDELSIICGKKWSRIFLISADKDLINHFHKNYASISNMELFIITKEKDSHLKQNPSLKLIDNKDFSFILFKLK